MIRRYDPTETTYTYNKYVLHPLTAEVREEANGIFEIELEVMRDAGIYRGDILTAPTPRGEQPFRVYRTVRTLKGKKVYARHIFYDLANNFLIDVRPTDLTCDGALKHILANTEVATSFTGSSDLVGLNTAYYVRKNPVEAIIGAENSILNTWGGNLVRNGKDIQIKAAGNDRGFEIRLGKNLIGIEDDSDESKVFTRLYPTVELDKVVYALPEKYVDSVYINNYPTPIIKEVRVALTKEEQELPLADIYTIMRSYCNNLFLVDNIDKPVANYKIDFVELSKVARIEQEVKYSVAGMEQLTYNTIETLTYEQLEGVTTVQQFINLLEQVDLYDMVRIRVLDLNLQAKVISYRYDALKQRYIGIELGGVKNTAKYQTANIIKQIQTDLENQKGLIEEAIEYATNLISGNKGGYVITRKHPDGKPYEILIMDTDDINTAIDVIRFNKAGIGFSQSGYNGPFTTAILIDGTVVAGTGFFNSLVTNLIQSDIGSSLNLQSNTSIKMLVGAGGRNIIRNGLFKGGIGDIALYSSTGGTPSIIVQNTEWTGSVPALAIRNTTASTTTVYVTTVSDLTVGKKYTVGCLGAGHRGRNKLVITSSNGLTVIGASNEVIDGQGGADISQWTELKFTFTATESSVKLRFSLTSTGADAYFWVRELRCYEGEALLPFEQHPDEAFSTSYTFDINNGFTLKDSNGAALITPNGVANEQNFSAEDNVEPGYPLKMSFHVGSQVSQITEVLLKWTNKPFRTYSKGAASGGGSTSGASSKSTSDSGSVTSFYTNLDTQLTYPNEGRHYHLIPSDQLSHSHGMEHTHSTPAHTHANDMGIIEDVLYTTRYPIDVYIDGVLRTSINAGQGIVDITAWITTNGWHTIELQSDYRKRIEVTLFMKNYIRR